MNFSLMLNISAFNFKDIQNKNPMNNDPMLQKSVIAIHD